MSKIICDICGTSYPETAAQCPICGCVRPGDVQRVSENAKKDGSVSTGYTYVKGGRFSKSNVKKRNNGVVHTNTVSKVSSSQKAEKTSDKSNRGLVITAIVLLLAIVAVAIYIAIRYFLPSSLPENPDKNSSNPPQQTQQQTDSQPDEKDLSCTGLILDFSTALFEQKGNAKLLTVTAEPIDTTDVITFKSSDETVATVTIDGKITAVGKGTAVITVACGDVSTECTVICDFEDETTAPTDETTDPTEETTEATKPSVDEFRLNRKDITFSAKNDSWVLYSGTIAKNLVKFSSENQSIATFVDGKVVAVGPGTTEVYAEYEGDKISCIIRCDFKESSGVGGNGGGVSEDGGSSGTVSGSSCAIYTQYGKASDITIKVNDTVSLTLKDAAGNTINVTWSVSGSGCSLSGNKVTGVVSGTTTTVSASYNGATYSCIIRVN